MKEHTQRDFGPKYGSCLGTCFACILDMDLEAVPNIGLFVRWIEALDVWAWQHGLKFHHAAGDMPGCGLGGCGSPRPTTGLITAGGESPRMTPDGFPMGHAVVWSLDENRMAWDPHPSRAGIVGRPVRWYWFTEAKAA